MKGKKQKQRKSGPMQRFAALSPERKRRLLLKGAVGLGIFGVAAGSISAHDSRQRELHDLAVVGAGKPVVVQVHDTTCPVCRNLKSRAMKVLSDQSRILYRIADLSDDEGRELQQKYSVGKTTLLLFDARGRLLEITVGLKPIEELEALFATHFPLET